MWWGRRGECGVAWRGECGVVGRGECGVVGRGECGVVGRRDGTGQGDVNVVGPRGLELMVPGGQPHSARAAPPYCLCGQGAQPTP